MCQREMIPQPPQWWVRVMCVAAWASIITGLAMLAKWLATAE